MGLLINVWGIYTELQNCMYQMASAFPNHCTWYNFNQFRVR
jgi:hypothetical protein